MGQLCTTAQQSSATCVPAPGLLRPTAPTGCCPTWLRAACRCPHGRPPWQSRRALSARSPTCSSSRPRWTRFSRLASSSSPGCSPPWSSCSGTLTGKSQRTAWWRCQTAAGAAARAMSAAPQQPLRNLRSSSRCRLADLCCLSSNGLVHHCHICRDQQASVVFYCKLPYALLST